MKKYYLVELMEDKNRKPRYYASDEEIGINDWVFCYQNNGSKLGLVRGIVECDKQMIKKIARQLGGTYPLVECGRNKKKPKNIFTLIGIKKNENKA